MSYHVVALWPVVMLDSVIVVECHDLFSLCLYNTDHCFPLSSNLSATNSTSSSVRVIIRSSLVCFLFFCVSYTYIVFLFVCEGCAPLPVTCTLSSPVCDVSPFMASSWPFVLGIVVFLLGLLGSALILDGLFDTATFLVLSAGLFVFTEEPSSAFPLGLVGCVVVGFIVVFSTGIFHCAGQSLIIQSIYSFVTQYCISNHAFFGSLVAWINM
jgi:hypothetical protein